MRIVLRLKVGWAEERKNTPFPRSLFHYDPDSSISDGAKVVPDFLARPADKKRVLLGRIFCSLERPTAADPNTKRRRRGAKGKKSARLD